MLASVTTDLRLSVIHSNFMVCALLISQLAIGGYSRQGYTTDVK
jgi:hypothetical protein